MEVMYTDLTHSADGLYSLFLDLELGDRSSGVVRLAVSLGTVTCRDFKELLVGVMLAHLLEDDVPLVGVSSLG